MCVMFLTTALVALLIYSQKDFGGRARWGKTFGKYKVRTVNLLV